MLTHFNLLIMTDLNYNEFRNNVRLRFAKDNNLEVANLNEHFERDEDLRRNYLNLMTEMYPTFVITSSVSAIREDFAKMNDLNVETLNEQFEQNENLRRNYLDFFSDRYSAVS